MLIRLSDAVSRVCDALLRVRSRAPLAAQPPADVELLAIGELLDAAAVEFGEFYPRFRRAQEQGAGSPYSADLQRGADLGAICDRIAGQAAGHHPTTLVGVAVLARAVRFRWRDDFQKDRSDLDLDGCLIVALAEGVLALAAATPEADAPA